jgi:predicted phage tail protein
VGGAYYRLLQTEEGERQLITIITIDNPFEPQKRRQESSVCTHVSIDRYFGDLTDRDVYLNGHAVDQEKYNMTYPVDNDQIIITPHIAGGGLKSILGTIAMIALTSFTGGVALNGIFGIAGKTLGSYLMSGAILYLGGRLINSVFPQQTSATSDNSGSQTYGWDLPTITTTEGGIIGETYGTCIPTPQLLEEHVETASDGKQYLNLLLCGGYGPVDSVSNIRIDRTPIDNFSGVQIETRLGTNDQEPISFFKNTPVDQEVSLTLEQDKPVIRTTDSAKASAIEITMEWSNGLYHLNNDGNYETTSVSFDIYYRLSGKTDWTKAESITVSNGSGDGFRKSYKYDVPDVGRYDVKIVMTSMPKGTRYMTNTTWSILTAYNSGVYSRPGKVLIGMRMLATNQLSGGLPSVNWRQTRSIVYVYNPTTSSYDEKPADNPIWATYDILHGCRKLKNINTGSMEYVVYGCSHESLDAYYDEWVSAAAYSDEMITNHDGEKEKRFMFDAFYDTTAKRYDAATKAAAVGHAAIIVHGKNYGIVVDRPGTMTQIFSEGRTTVSSVNGTFTSRDERAHSVEITYNDEQNDFTNTQFTLRSPSYTTDNGGQDNTAQLTLFGVSRRSQAYREGITALATNERQMQFVELSTDIDGLVAEYGDIVGYNHAVSRIGIAGGRIVSATAGTVTLDKSVDIDATKTYEIYIQMSDDVLVKREIVPKTETTSTLTLTQPFDTVPQKYDVYSFGETGKSVKPFRIVSASRDGDMLVKLKLAEYDEAIYATELDYSKYPIIDYTSSQSWASIRGVTAAESSRVSGGASISDIVVEWSMMGTGRMPDSYIIELTANDGTYSEQISTKLTSCTFHSVPHQKIYTVAVSCVYDVVTTGKTTTTVYVQGIGVSAANVRGLVIAPIEGGLRLTWTAADDTSVVGYDIYRGPIGSSISDCEKISAAQASTLLDVEQTDAGSWIFYVRAVDSTGKQVGQAISNIGTITLPGPVLSANAVTMYRQYQDGTTGYDIVATYQLPKNKIVRTGLVYYKTNNVDVSELGTIPEGVPADELGYSADWKYAGNGESKVVIPAAQLGDTYKLKIVAQDTTGLISSDNDARYVTVPIAAKTAVPNTPQNFKYKFSAAGGFQLMWDDVANSDVDFYECRTNDAPGAADGLLARVTGTNARVNLANRKGILYLYAHNKTGKYSYPASVEYRMDKPAAPKNIVIQSAPRAAIITVPPIPDGADGIRLQITGDKTTIVDIGATTTYTYAADPDIYTMTACYYDVFGDGEQSDRYTMTIKPTFNSEWIADESISLAKVDSVIDDALAKGKSAYEGVTNIVANLNSDGHEYSAITQLSDDINLRVKKDSVVAQINLSTEGVAIAGKYLHVSGETKFDDSVIVNKMLAAHAITADKMSVDSLSAISATLGSVEAGDIVGSTFRNKDRTFSIDANGNIVGAKITGSSLELSSADLKAAGLKISAVTFMKGAISSGGTIPLPDGYTADECIWWAVANGDYIASIDANRTVTFRHLKNETKSDRIHVSIVVDNKMYDGWSTYYYVSSEWESGGSGIYYIFGVKK